MRPAALLALGLVLAAFVPAMATQAQTPSPDLAVTHVGWDQLVEGDDTTFNATIENVGDAAYDEDEFDVRFHLEDDGFDETVTVSLDGGMEAGEEHNVSAGEPWQAEIGTHTINATVHEDEGLPRLGEDLEANDHRNRTFAIGPDILMHEVRLEPSSPIADQSVDFFAEIENDATDEYDITDPFIVSFEVRDGDGNVVATLESLPLDELRAKDPEEVTARTDWDADAGSYTVVAKADPDGNITEADEDNNEAERAFSVKAAVPDLAVMDVAPADGDVAAGEESPIEATIENRGTADVTNDFPVRFRVNGTTHGPDVHVQVDDGLKPGGEMTVESETWMASEGHHDLVAIADPGNNNVTDETKLANNELTRELHVGPDLVVEDILWTPDPAAAGHEVTIEPVVRNQGTADVTQQTTLELRLPDEDESWTVDVDPLGAGNATQIEAATWTPPEDDTDDYPYDVVVEAEVDIDDEASEVDDDNNLAQDAMTVTEPRPDIVTEALTLDPGSPDVGQATRIEATIRNDGSAEADEVEVAFLVDGDEHGDTRTIASGFDTLEAGEEATVTSDAWEPTLGEHTLTVHPFLPDDGQEVREDNNNGTLEALIGPDALVEDISWDPEDPEAQDEVSFDVTVANAGTEAIDELGLALEVDGEQVGQRTLEELGSETNRTVTVTWNATEGDHTVRAIADPGDEIAEARETNNEREESFSTTASPDLQPTSIRWSEDAEAGDKLVFTATIANTGTAPVEGSFTVSFLVGDEAVGTATLEGLAVGTSKSVSSDAWTAEAGTHSVTVEADADDAVTEDNEDNNDRVAVVTVQAKQDDDEPETGPPNLVVTGLSAPEDVEPGDEVTFLATIENTGGQRAAASDVRFLVGDEVLGEPSLDALAPGQSQSIASDAWNATAGEQAVTAIADVRDDVDESDEEDNERIKRIQVGDVEDDGAEDRDGEGISLGAISVEDPRAGEPVRPAVQVTNNGEEARNVTVTFFIDGTRLGQTTFADLGPGEEDTLEGPIWEPTSGEHTITAQTDDDQTEAIVDVAAGESADVPMLPLVLLLASLVAASLGRRRRG